MMTQPITIDTAVCSPPDRHSPAEMSASSVSSIDWSISSASVRSQGGDSDDDNHQDPSQRTPGKSTRPVSLAFADLTSTTEALSLTEDEDDTSPTTSPKRVRVLSGSTAPTSLLSDDKREVLDSSDEDDDETSLSGSARTMAASAPNTPAFRRADKRKENRPRAQTDASTRMRRGSKQLNLGMLEGATADELASWVSRGGDSATGRIRLASWALGANHRSPSRTTRSMPLPHPSSQAHPSPRLRSPPLARWWTACRRRARAATTAPQGK